MSCFLYGFIDTILVDSRGMDKGTNLNITSKLRVLFDAPWCVEFYLLVGLLLMLGTTLIEFPNSNMLFGIAIVLIGVGLLIQIRNKVEIKRFIGSIRSAINQGIQGNAYNAIESIQTIPETKILIDDIEAVISSLNTINGMVGNVSASLALHANELSEKSTSVVEQMHEQLSKTDMTHTSVEALAGVFSTALITAEQTVDVASKSEAEGESGKLVMTQAMSSVTGLSESVVDAGGMIENLAAESEEIGGIINVIKGVAEQTNLLALNAAIEAARAGEQGRGFAVVADEVRSLAGKTQQYASEIETIIGSLMTRINDVTNKVKDSVNLASESDELIESVVVSYSEIVGYMLEVSKLGKELADITKHEKNASENVFQMLDEIRSISQSTSEKIQHMQSSSSELGGLGQQLGVITNTVSNIDTDEASVDLF